MFRLRKILHNNTTGQSPSSANHYINKPGLNTVRKNRFLIVRHGESVWNQDSKFTGWTNIPLTEKGRKEAYEMSKSMLRNNLKPTVIFSSVLQRAIDTSNIIRNEINAQDTMVYTSWRLNERHYGQLEGIPRKYIRTLYGTKFTQMLRTNYYMKPPTNIDFDNTLIVENEYSIFRNCYYMKIKNGESKENVLERLLPYYENDILYTLSEGKLPLIVTHKHTARVLMKHLLKINDADFENYELPNKTILCVTLDDNLNYESHQEIPY